MDTIWQGLKQAIELLVSRDPETWEIILRSLRVSGTATFIGALLGVPLGTVLGLIQFRGRSQLSHLVNTGMGLPPVVVGLLLSLVLSRYGPLGFMGLIYTPTAMIVAQAIIVTPLIAGFTLAAIAQIDPLLPMQLASLGASRLQVALLVIREMKFSVVSGVLAGFGRAISEVGASAMVGGNIPGDTRVMTTAIMLEVNKGNFEIAVALGTILILIAYVVSLGLAKLQRRRKAMIR